MHFGKKKIKNQLRTYSIKLLNETLFISFTVKITKIKTKTKKLINFY